MAGEMAADVATSSDRRPVSRGSVPFRRQSGESLELGGGHSRLRFQRLEVGTDLLLRSAHGGEIVSAAADHNVKRREAEVLHILVGAGYRATDLLGGIEGSRRAGAHQQGACGYPGETDQGKQHEQGGPAKAGSQPLSSEGIAPPVHQFLRASNHWFRQLSRARTVDLPCHLYSDRSQSWDPSVTVLIQIQKCSRPEPFDPSGAPQGSDRR